MIKILKNKKGMTLVELIVGMLLFTIVATTLSAIILPMLQVHIKANEIAECNTLLDNLANQIISDLSNAKSEPKDPAGTDGIEFYAGPDYVKYTVASDGTLLKSDSPDKAGSPVLSKSFYKNKSVAFSWAPEATGYKLTITISSDRGGDMISREYSVRPLGLNP